MNDSTRICPCGREFAKVTNRKFCSEECESYKSNRVAMSKRYYDVNKRAPTKPISVCECGTTFQPRSCGRPQRWCSHSCDAYVRYHRSVSRATYQRRRPAAIAVQRDYAMNNPGKIRAWQLSKYGITPDDYASFFSTQNGRCAICGTDKPSKRRVFFDVDHCHTTGKVRGLLCEVCNRSIGLLKDSPELLRRAADYLEK